jgi:antitoxin VapB
VLAPPICHVAEIDIADANGKLIAWGHRMGPCNRPNGAVWAHGLFEHGKPVAVAIAAGLIREKCAGFSREDAFELARLCAARPTLCRVMLRLWREMVAPAICRAHGFRWAVSYQDKALHSGNTYRLDGWKVVGESRSGTDPRSGRKGRSKRIWGWEVAA